jgi:probable rRNA maturation factor
LEFDKKILNEIFEFIDELIIKKQKWILNIVFLSNKEIQKLNKNFRNIDKPTDVLSFHYFEDFSSLKNNDIAWEIVISFEKLFSQAKEFWIENKEEFYKLVIHSILHILWYDHEKQEDYQIMQNLENKVYEKINLEKLKINI